MITLTNTPNNLGVLIKGDYNDLNSLYDSLANYVNFYIDNIILDCQEEEKDSEEKIEGLPSYTRYFELIRDNIFGLCHDLRKAYEGQRNVHQENNGDSINTYYSVEIFYPWALYYLFILEDMTNNYYEKHWLSRKKTLPIPKYSETEIMQDTARIKLFIADIWCALKALLGDNYPALYYYYQDKETDDPADSGYIAGMCDYLVKLGNKIKNNNALKQARKAAVTLIAYELLCPEELLENNEYAKKNYAIARQQYRECGTKLEEITQQTFLTHSKFSAYALLYAKEHNYEFDEEEFLHSIFGDFQESNFIW